MKLYTINGDAISATKTRRPKMSWTQGRGWDAQDKTIDGQSVQFHYEVSYGRRMYFQWKGQWYVARMFQNTDPFDFHLLTTEAES